MNIWVLEDSRTGNTHQAIALAEKLAGEYTLIRLEYNCLAKLPNFLLKYYPIHIKNEILQDIIVKPLPDVIITAGRRTAALAFYLKKTLLKEIALMQIMQLALPYETFNLVILPYHDLRHCEATKWLWQSQDFFIRLLRRCHASPRKNILPINGAINNVTTKFAVAEAELQKYYPKLEEFIAVIIGGNNKKFNFNEEEATLFASLLKTIYTNQKYFFSSVLVGVHLQW